MNWKPLPADPRVRIRIEKNSISDHAQIRAVNEAAFGGVNEADLVERLRADGHVLFSIVAEFDSEIQGHCMFSRMWINASARLVPAVALAPVAVHPTHQREQIGSRLIQHGLELVREQGERIVIVVGHPDYYPRFGFSTRNAESLERPFPREVFMALGLRERALEGILGSVVYPPAFGI
jgi:putative acetyltransferase